MKFKQPAAYSWLTGFFSTEIEADFNFVQLTRKSREKNSCFHNSAVKRLKPFRAYG